ncbi:MAG: aspartate-semialdehyde dehydrogenase [Bacteroidales bacterium]|nr:aspartate-semialdehyde dehydrogenase [Bacteroidales bacterium]
MRIAVVGATGLVGDVMLTVLQESALLRDAEIIPAASERSVGKKLTYGEREFEVVSLKTAVEMKPDIALFSAGGDVSKEWAPKFAKAGCMVIDNSSAWRMDKKIPLVVPEINAAVIKPNNKIIANPNCSTIQMVLALAPLHRAYGIRRLVVATYQSVTGSGMKGVRQLEHERKGSEGEKAYPHPIDLNVLPHGGSFDKDGYTSEEVKLVNETRKILDEPQMRITSTVVRVPVYGGHSEAVNVELDRDFRLNDIRGLLEQTKGVVVQDAPLNNHYPMPIFARGKNEVFVGRLRRDFSNENSLNMWVVSDNLRKGAATNAVQIAEYLVEHKLTGGN